MVIHSDKRTILPGPIDKDEPNVFEIENVIAFDMKGRHRDKLRFKVNWVGYPSSEACWTNGFDTYESAKDECDKFIDALPRKDKDFVLKVLRDHAKRIEEHGPK